MFFLFSGEWGTDCGTCSYPDRICTGDSFQPGPMVVLASQIVERDDHYSPVDSGCCGLVLRPVLNNAIGDLKARRKSPKLPGRHRARETLHFQRSAQALARLAKQWAAEICDEVVAIYFRDNDDHQSTPASLWKAKIDAVYAGFMDEGFARGVAMIPRPTSEAWLLCALKSRPYEKCIALEERSGSPNTEKPLKKELESILGVKPTRELLNMQVADGKVDSACIDMPSFNAFHDRLLQAIRPMPGTCVF